MKATLLFINSVLILNRPRFLAKYGFDLVDMHTSTTDNPLKSQIIGFLHAVQYLKVPMIALNTIAIVFELLLGGA
jgi:hypothetical protein